MLSFTVESLDGISPVLSKSFEVDVPTGKVGGLFLSSEGMSFLRGSGGIPPQNIWKFRCLEMLFCSFVTSHAKTFLTISVQTAERTASERIRNG